MRYIVIAEDSNQLKIEIAQQKEEVIFSTYEEAQEFIQQVKQENVLPEKYKLKVEPYAPVVDMQMNQKEQE